MHTVLPKRVLAGARGDKSTIRVSPLLLETAALDPATVFARLSTGPEGLTSDQGAARLAEHGPNVLPRDERPGLARLLCRSVLNPLVLLLGVLATVSISTGDPRAATMIVLSVGLKLFQEAKAGSTAAKLEAMISVHATVLRDRQAREIPLSQLIPG